jgi:hypothetical protein
VFSKVRVEKTKTRQESNPDCDADICTSYLLPGGEESGFPLSMLGVVICTKIRTLPTKTDEKVFIAFTDHCLTNAQNAAFEQKPKIMCLRQV